MRVLRSIRVGSRIAYDPGVRIDHTAAARPPAEEKSLRFLATNVGDVERAWLGARSLSGLHELAQSRTTWWPASFNKNHSNDVVASNGRRVHGERADAFVYWVELNPKENAL